MIRRTMGLLAALGMMAGAGLVVAAPASAGTCETIGGVRVCGKITNNAGSGRTLPVTCDLAGGVNGGNGSTNPTWQQNHDSAFRDYREVQPGALANCTDSDGYHVPWGYWASQNQGTVNYENPDTIRVEYNISPNHWKKIRSDERVNVRLYKYPAGQGPSRCCND